MKVGHVPDSVKAAHTLHTIPRAISGEVSYMNQVLEYHPNQCHGQYLSHVLPLLTHPYRLKRQLFGAPSADTQAIASSDQCKIFRTFYMEYGILYYTEPSEVLDPSHSPASV